MRLRVANKVVKRGGKYYRRLTLMRAVVRICGGHFKMTDIERRLAYLEARCDRLENTLKTLFRYVRPDECQELETIDSAMDSAQRVLLTDV